MKVAKTSKIWIALCMVFMLVFGNLSISMAAPSHSNRFNIVIVADASGSMKSTDPNGLRFEAMKQFISLLSQKGNYLGAVVFSDNVVAKQDLTLIQDQSGKDQTMLVIKGVAPGGDTNIGEGLKTAMEMLENQKDKSLPSVILFLSDGNTDLKTKEALQASLDNKADAIQMARENGVAIYSICLNADQSADVSEMQQISDATGGFFKEVGSAKDLQDVFSAFYDKIYGSATQIDEQEFPADGVVEKKFMVPEIGVEEVNVVITGKANSIEVRKPDGTNVQSEPIISDTFTILKLTDVVAGEWTLITTGVPGDKIKINMVYNSVLEIALHSEALENVTNPKDKVQVQGKISANGKAADASSITSYLAELEIRDAYGNTVDTTSMEIEGDTFVSNVNLPEGNYFVQARVYNDYVEKYSESIGPILVSATALTEEEKQNTPPQPVEKKITKKIYVIPFRKNKLVIDFKGMAKDAQDGELVYKLDSSSFIEGKDYTVDADAITMQKYSLSKGSFDILAIDSGGLSCHIEVVVKAVNVGLWTTIIIGIIALLILTVVLIQFVRCVLLPFGGKITVYSFKQGTQFYKSQIPGRTGRLKLQNFLKEYLGLPVRGAYFQASGKKYVTLVFKKEVFFAGRKVKRIKITAGIEATIKASMETNDYIKVKFDSLLKR